MATSPRHGRWPPGRERDRDPCRLAADAGLVPRLVTGDLADFHRQATEVTQKALPTWIALSDRKGRVLLSSLGLRRGLAAAGDLGAGGRDGAVLAPALSHRCAAG